MSVPIASTSSPTGSTYLSAVIDALDAFLTVRGDESDVTIYADTRLTFGDLRAIAAALDGIHIPGHVEKDWAEITDSPAEHWCVARYQAGRMFATERHYFVPAVTA